MSDSLAFCTTSCVSISRNNSAFFPSKSPIENQHQHALRSFHGAALRPSSSSSSSRPTVIISSPPPISPPRMQETGDVDDAPSDTYVPAAEAEGGSDVQVTSKRASLTGRLLQLCAVTGRGMYATEAQMAMIDDIVMQLEEINPTQQPVNTDLIDGYWTLVYSSLTTSSSNSNLRTAVKILLTPVLQLGQVRQRINVADGTLVSEADITAFPATSATLKTNARCTPVGGERLELTLEKTNVTGGKLVDALDLGGLSFDIPVEQILNRIRNMSPETYIDTYYLDDKLRISRSKDGKLFIYTRLD